MPGQAILKAAIFASLLMLLLALFELYMGVAVDPLLSFAGFIVLFVLIWTQM